MPKISFLERYRNGEHVAVWNELTALGAGVRHKLYYDDAVAVANETMRRVRRNVEMLIPRLAEIGYRFVAPADDDGMAPDRLDRMMASVGGTVVPVSSLPGFEEARARMQKAMAPFADQMSKAKAEMAARVKAALEIPPLANPAVFDPPNNETAKGLARLEKTAGGPLPISLRAWYEQVGGVSLMGSHPVLNPLHEGPGDPLVVERLELLLEMLDAFGDGEDEDGGIGLWIAPDDFHKANISGGEPYTIRIPNAAADAKFEYEWHDTTFVNYLRKAFEWGGFPGWEQKNVKRAPRDIIAQLTDGLLPI